MNEPVYAEITREQLAKKLRDAPPRNDDPREGYALVHVLGRDVFAKEHIPHSINIPKDEIEEFAKRFDTGKEVVVYCASRDCDASPKVAEQLTRRGFQRVVDYAGGLRDWKQGGHRTESQIAVGPPSEEPS